MLQSRMLAGGKMTKYVTYDTHSPLDTHDIHFFRSKSGSSLVRISLPPTWNGVECERDKKVDSPTGVRPDLVIVDAGVAGDQDDGGSVWSLQHGGCGEQGLQLTASSSFFKPTTDIMKHHEKGINQLGIVVAFLRIEIVAL